MARPPPLPPPDPWQTEVDLLAVGREHLERLCGGWRIRHLYPRGADASLLLLAYQELDRQRAIGRVRLKPRAQARALRKILDALVRRDALARNRRIAYRLPSPRGRTAGRRPDVVQIALDGLDDPARAIADTMLDPSAADPEKLGSTATVASERAQQQVRDAVLGAVLARPDAIAALHPSIVAMLASAQPEVRRHPLATYLFLKLPLQLLVALLTLINVAYIGAYYFFNDEVLGRFISTRVSGLIEGELELGSVHWSGRLILDLLTGQPSDVVVREVTIYEPNKSYGGERRIAAYAEQVDARLVLHEIIPWNRLAIPAVFEVPWALHFAEVQFVGPARFDVRGYRDEHDDGRIVSLIGLRDAFLLHNAIPNQRRGLSFAVDHAVLGPSEIDVDFTEIADWRFATTLAGGELGLRFVSLSPHEPIPAALPLQFSLVGTDGSGSLTINAIHLPIDAVEHLHMRGGTGDTPYGDVRFDARATSAGSPIDLDGRLRYALVRNRDSETEPLAYGTPVIWGPEPVVEMRASSRSPGSVIAHVLAELELPDYAVDGNAGSIVARIEGPLSDPVYHLAAEGLSIDALDEPAWVVDDALVSVELATDRAPDRWSTAYPTERLVARFDTFEGSVIDGTVRLRDGESATIVLPADDTEPLLLDGDFDLGSINPGKLVLDNPDLGATLAGTASGRIRIDELRLGPVAPPVPEGAPPLPPELGLQRVRLELHKVGITRDRGPATDGIPRALALDGTVTIDQQGAIDWDALTITMDGAELRSTGAINGDLDVLDETQLDFTIDDGIAFARALDIPRYVDDVRARITVDGPLGAPNGRDGRIRFTPIGSAVSGPTETHVSLDAGTLHVRGEDVQLLGGTGDVDLTVHMFERGEVSGDPKLRADVDLRGVDLGPLSRGEVEGVANIDLEVGDGEGGAARASKLRVKGTAEVPELRYASTEYRDATLAFRWTKEQLAIEKLVLPLHRRVSPSGEGSTDLEVGRLVIDGTVGLVGDSALDLHVLAGGIPLAAVGELIDTDIPVRGQVGHGTELDVDGTLSRPSVEGKVALVGLTAFGIALGSGTLEVESEDAPAQGSLAAHREVWAKGELTTGPRGDAQVDWSIDAVVAIGKPKKRGGPPVLAAQVDIGFDRVGLPLLLGAADIAMPGVEGELEGLEAHVLVCDATTPMLSDCAGKNRSDDGLVALAVSLDRAWIRPKARSTVARQQRATAKSPCLVAGTLCAEGLHAALEGDILRLETPLRLRSPDGTNASLSGAFDLSAPPAVAVAEASKCRAPAPPPPKVGTLAGDAPPPSTGTRATLEGTIALGALQALLEPYGLATAKGLIEVELDLDGPVRAPRLGGRLDIAPKTESLWIQPKGLAFPIELSEVAVAINNEWLAARGAVRVFGETMSFGLHAGERTGFAFAGPCAGHFDIAAAGTLGTRLLTTLIGDAANDASGGIDVEHAVVSGTASPFSIERAEGTLAFTDHELRIRPAEGLDELVINDGRIVITRCGVGQCEEVPSVPEGALAMYIGGTGAPADQPAADAVVAEIGSRGRFSTWGRLYLDPETGMPIYTELDMRLVDVAYRDFDPRGRPVAEAEVSARRLSLRGADPIVVQGEIELARARYVKDAIQGADILAFADDVEVAETPPPDLIRNMQFDLRVLTDDPLRVENNVASGVEANASVTVSGTYDAPELAGRIDFESGGRVDLPFLSGTFAIQRGRVNLLGAIEDAEVDIGALREEPIYKEGQPHELQLVLEGTLAEIRWRCVTDGDPGGSGETARSCFDYLVLGTNDVQVSDADVRRFGGGGLSEARKPLQVVGHVTELDLDERASEAVPRLRGYVPDMKLRLGQIGPELRIATPQEWFDFDYGRLSLGWDYTRGYPGFFLRQSRQVTVRLELLEPITLEFSRRIRSYLNQRVIFDPLTQRTLELRFDITLPSAK